MKELRRGSNKKQITLINQCCQEHGQRSRDAALVIIDECSMVDAKMGEDLLSFQDLFGRVGDPRTAFTGGRWLTCWGVARRDADKS